jgi:hypothetical protein
MQLPDPNASSDEHKRFARYVSRKLRRAKLTALEALIADVLVTLGLRKAAVEAAEDAAIDALADRDGVDDDGDDKVQQTALTIRSRTLNGAKEEPYTLVFPEGVDGVLDLPIAGISAGLRGLGKRLEQHFPETDPVRADVPVLNDFAARFDAARAAADDADTAVANARGALESTKLQLRTLLERIYGELVASLGRRAAERFFPKRTRKGATPPTTPA